MSCDLENFLFKYYEVDCTQRDLTLGLWRAGVVSAARIGSVESGCDHPELVIV